MLIRATVSTKLITVMYGDAELTIATAEGASW